MHDHDAVVCRRHLFVCEISLTSSRHLILGPLIGVSLLRLRDRYGRTYLPTYLLTFAWPRRSNEWIGIIIISNSLTFSSSYWLHPKSPFGSHHENYANLFSGPLTVSFSFFQTILQQIIVKNYQRGISIAGIRTHNLDFTHTKFAPLTTGSLLLWAHENRVTFCSRIAKFWGKTLIQDLSHY